MPNKHTISRRQEFLNGAFQELPLQLGVAPFGLVFGVLGLASGLSPLETVLMSSILFGGASQVVFVKLWTASLPLPVVVASVAMINLRHALYSASVAPFLRGLPLSWRIILAYLLTDEAYAISINRFRYQAAGPYQHYHLLGTGLTLWLCWQISTLIGVVFGSTIPNSLSLDFVIPLTFIAIVAPAIKKKADLAACVTAGILSVIGQPLPWNGWIILAALGGIASGWLVNRAENIYKEKSTP